MYKVHLHRWKQNLLLFVLSRVIISQELRQKNIAAWPPGDHERNRGSPVAGNNRPALNEKVLLLTGTTVQYCIYLTDIVQKVRKMFLGNRLTPLDNIALLHSTFSSRHSVKLQAQTSVLQESACSTRAGVCHSNLRNKAYKQLHLQVESKPAAMDNLGFVTWRLALYIIYI